MADDNLYVTVSIPVKGHVKKYLCTRYGTEHTLTKNSLLGMLIYHSLSQEIERQPVSISELPFRYCVNVSEFYMSRKGHTVKMKTRKFLGLCLETLFLEDMKGFIDKCLSGMGLTAMASLKIFLQTYGISEEDVKIESLYRNYQRYSGEDIKKKKRRPA
jgi:hypothetical protein